MFTQKKAHYNRLLFLRTQINKDELQHWQMENFREKTTEELIGRLFALGFRFDMGDLVAYARGFETPEDLAEALTKESAPLEKDHIYLIVFELWRRLFPERRTLTIFCDELDFQIREWNLGKKIDIEGIQDLIAYLQQILNEHLDAGLKPKQAFTTIQSFLASELEFFLFDYCMEQIEEENYPYATEILDGFESFLSKPEWFEYLRARAEILRDPEEGYEKLEELISRVKWENHFELGIEILYFLAGSGNHTLFHLLAKMLAPLLEKETDFREFLEICFTHYDFLELKTLTMEIAEIFHHRSKEIPLDNIISRDDEDMKKIIEVLNQKLSFAQEG